MLESVLSFPISYIAIAIAVFSVLYVTGLWSYYTAPGPWGIPILGYYPFLRKDFYRQLEEMTKKYGEVYLINLVGQTFVYLGSLKTVREAHVIKADYFDGRSQKFSLIKQLLDNGLALMEGDEWKTQRKFFVQSLREAGHNRNMEALTAAVASTLEAFHNTKAKPFDICATLSKETNLVVRRVMLGDNVTEEQVQGIKDAFFDVVKPLTGLNLLLVGEIARKFVFPRKYGFKEMLRGTKTMSDLMRKIVSDHKTTFDPDQPPRDFIDMYLREREIRKKKGDPLYKSFTDEALVSNLRQAYGDGTESIAIFLASFLNHLSLHLDVQDMIYEQIIRVAGTERLPTLDDRVNLPIVHSAIKELLRLTKFMTVSASLECKETTDVLGVHVPKGAITLVNFWSVNRDPKNYENSEVFNAKRFMPDKGKVEQPITFGVGRRACAGESFVLNEIFMFLTGIVQNFLILPETDDEVEDKNEQILELEELFKIKLRMIPRKRGRFGSMSS